MEHSNNTSMTYNTVTTVMKCLTMTAVHFSIEHNENCEKNAELFMEICTILKFVKRDKNFLIFKEA